MIDTEEKYIELLTTIRRHVSKQTHQEFLVSYFTQLKTTTNAEDISISEYTQQVDELQKSIMSRMQEVNHILEANGQAPIDIMPSDYRDMTRNPVGAMTKEKMIGGVIVVGFL